MKITNKEAFIMAFWICGIMGVIGNITLSIMNKNPHAMIGWIVALCFYPYENIKRRAILT